MLKLLSRSGLSEELVGALVSTGRSYDELREAADEGRDALHLTLVTSDPPADLEKSELKKLRKVCR